MLSTLPLLHSSRYKVGRAWYTVEVGGPQSCVGESKAGAGTGTADPKNKIYAKQERVLHWVEDGAKSTDGKWYPALVLEVIGSGSSTAPFAYTLQYDDGTVCSDVQEHHMASLVSLPKLNFEQMEQMEQVRILKTRV